MLTAAIVIFVIALCFGLALLVAVLTNRPTPKPVVLIHGCAAIIALALIITYMLKGHFQPLLITSIVLFILAALGGLSMLSFDLRKKPIPKAFAIMHPLLALTAFLMLIIFSLP